jgi:hypothetical protein
MITAAAYVLKVPQNRRDILLQGRDVNRFVAEPVSKFDHGFRAPLVVLACFSNDAITHIADGHKGNSAGTGLVRLNLHSLAPLDRPIPFAAQNPWYRRRYITRTLAWARAETRAILPA